VVEECGFDRLSAVDAGQRPALRAGAPPPAQGKKKLMAANLRFAARDFGGKV